MPESLSAIEDEQYVPRILNELATVDLGDKRRNARLLKIVQQITPCPEKSIPKSAGSMADLQATYRLLENEDVHHDDILAPHVAKTIERCQIARRVIVVHDTSVFGFSGETRRKNLGVINSPTDQGFLGHFSFAFGSDEASTPLGTLAFLPWTRERIGKNAQKRTATKEKESKQEAQDQPSEEISVEENESVRWLQQIRAVQKLASNSFDAIHVTDREGDIFSLFCALKKESASFVIRSHYTRKARLNVDSSIEDVQVLANAACGILEVEVELSQRNRGKYPAQTKAFPPRESRKTKLTFKATHVLLQRPKHEKSDLPTWLSLNLVHVVEENPPEGESPVEWYLYTSLPVDTASQVKDVVDIYRKRWGIEEFFKALKTGCEIERRQLESYESLLNLLALFLPVAWQMLLLRTISRHAPNAPASIVLSETQIDVLRECGKVELSKAPTAKEALFAVAALGGYIKYSKKPPGWITLGRGMEELMIMEKAWVRCMERAKRCAQS